MQSLSAVTRLQSFPVLGAVILVLPVSAHEQKQVVSSELSLVGHRLLMLASLLIHAVQADACLQRNERQGC